MQEFTVVQSKSQEHGEWKTSMGLTKFFVSPGKKNLMSYSLFSR